MTNEERIAMLGTQPHYVLSPTVAVITADHSPEWYFVIHNGKTVCAERSDTRAIAYADELHSEEIADNPTPLFPTVAELAKSDAELCRIANQPINDTTAADLQPLDIATGAEIADADIATLAIGDAVTRWNVHKQNGTLDSPEARATDALLAQHADRWAMDRSGYLYLL